MDRSDSPRVQMCGFRSSGSARVGSAWSPRSLSLSPRIRPPVRAAVRYPDLGAVGGARIRRGRAIQLARIGQRGRGWWSGFARSLPERGERAGEGRRHGARWRANGLVGGLVAAAHLLRHEDGAGDGTTRMMTGPGRGAARLRRSAIILALFRHLVHREIHMPQPSRGAVDSFSPSDMFPLATRWSARGGPVSACTSAIPISRAGGGRGHGGGCAAGKTLRPTAASGAARRHRRTRRARETGSPRPRAGHHDAGSHRLVRDAGDPLSAGDKSCARKILLATMSKRGLLLGATRFLSLGAGYQPIWGPEG